MYIDELKAKYTIPVSGKELEKLEDSNMAPWATKNSEIRYYGEDKSNEETYRTRFRRDRDRILYSKAFRRLQYKTQVMVTDAGDDFRTRLTHSLEVEQIAMSQADALRLNRDLVSAIALGHDLGHTPFGHAVEALLDEVLEFSHAVQSVRYLVDQAKDRNGIQISIQVLEGILKHDSDIFSGKYQTRFWKQHNCEYLKPDKVGSMESQVVFWADKVAYLTHDFEDFKRSGILDNAISEGKISKAEIDDVLNKLISDTAGRETRDLLRNINNELIAGTLENLAKENPQSAEQASEISTGTMLRLKESGIPGKEAYQASLIVNLRQGYRDAYNRLRKIINENYLHSPDVTRFDTKAKRITRSIINEFISEQSLLPWKIQKYIDDGKDDKKRAIADFIASMTDRQIKNQYQKLFEIEEYNQYE